VSKQCPDCRLFMKRNDAGEHQCVNPHCPFRTALQKAAYEAVVQEGFSRAYASAMKGTKQ
jgi:hypothetical protein